MIQAGFFSVFNFIANNKAAQVILTAGFIVAIWFLNNRHQRSIGGRKVKARIEKQSRRVQQTIEEENDQRLEKARRTRNDFRAIDADDSYVLSDEAIARIARRHGTS